MEARYKDIHRGLLQSSQKGCDGEIQALNLKLPGSLPSDPTVGISSWKCFLAGSGRPEVPCCPTIDTNDRSSSPSEPPVYLFTNSPLFNLSKSDTFYTSRFHE